MFPLSGNVCVFVVVDLIVLLCSLFLPSVVLSLCCSREALDSAPGPVGLVYWSLLLAGHGVGQ